jgi:hypothetical protein
MGASRLSRVLLSSVQGPWLSRVGVTPPVAFALRVTRVKNIIMAVVGTVRRNRRKSVRLVTVKYHWSTFVSVLNGRLARRRRLVMGRIPSLCLWGHRRRRWEGGETVNNVFEAVLEVLRELVIRPWYLAWERRRGRRR